MRIALTTLRFLTTWLILLLLLNPLLRRQERIVQPPILAIATDNSASIPLNKDSAYYRNQFPEALKQATETVEKKWTTRTFNFGKEVGDSLRFTFKDKGTNGGELMEQLRDRFAGQNLGAVVIATDGLFNKGKNPVYEAQSLHCPIYVVALGDTTPQRDLSIRRLRHNSMAFKGNDFEIEAGIHANLMNGRSGVATLYKVENRKETEIGKSSFGISGPSFDQALKFTAPASVGGMMHLRLRLTTFNDEVSKANNTRDFFIEVLDDKTRILIYAQSPHPDVSAIRALLEAKQNTEVKIAIANNSQPVSFNGYDLIIFHQLPASSNTDVGMKARAAGIPSWFIGGLQTNYGLLNQCQSAVNVRPAGQMTNQITANVATEFGLFTLSEEFNKRLPQLPPLDVPYGDYFNGSNSQVLLRQQIRNIQTSMPLMAFGETGGVREAVLTGEGLWKWRLEENLIFGNQDALNELVSKTVQYLTLKTDKRPFRARPDESIFEEGEEVLFSAELFNKAYEAVNTPEVQIDLTHHDGKSIHYTFAQTENRYVLNAGKLPSGLYKYKATTTFQGVTHTAEGTFSVQGNDEELSNTTANHQLLRTLAAETGGEVIYPNQLAQLTEILNKRNDLKPMSYMELLLNEVLNLPWIMVVLFVLISTEWFLRKWLGGY